MNGYSNDNVNFEADEDMQIKSKTVYYGIDINETKEEEPESVIVNEWISTKLADEFDVYMDISGDIVADNEITETEEEESESSVVSEPEEKEEILYNSEESEIDSDSGSESDILSNIKELALRDNKIIVDRAMESYKLQYGEYPSLELLEKGLYTVGRSLLNGYEKESDEEELSSESESDVLFENKDVMEFSDELEDALSVASKMGSSDQEYLANTVLNTYYEINEKEASLDELANIFENIKSEFEYEAMDDILYIGSDNESDDDYIVTKNDIIQAVLDLIDSEDENEEDETETENESEFSDNSEEDNSDNDSSYDPENDCQDYSADHQLYE